MENIKEPKKNLQWHDRALTCNNSVLQMRSLLFAPVERADKSTLYKEFIKNKSKIIVYNYDNFEIELRNRFLTQVHRDILDILLSKAIKKDFAEGIKIICETTFYKIQKELAHKYNKNGCFANNKWLSDKIDELKDVVIKITDDKNNKISFNILGLIGKNENNKIVIYFDSSYLQYFYSNDIGINYKKYIKDIVCLKSAQEKALIRYILSNTFKDDNFNMNINDILQKIGINKINTTLRRYQIIIKKIKDNKELLFQKFNIEIKGDTVKYKKLDNISVYNINHKQAQNNIPLLIDETQKRLQEFSLFAD